MLLSLLFGGIVGAKSMSFLCWKQWLNRERVGRLLVVWGRSGSWALCDCRVFKVPGIPGNVNCLWFQLVLVFQWCHAIYRSTQWISCLWTCRGVHIVWEKHLNTLRNWGLRGAGGEGVEGGREREREFSQALILQSNESLNSRSLIFWVWIQLF